MITRAQMPRQLRDKGGIASVTPREKYGLGSKIKERFRKLIPNELAGVAVAAAPFVAPFNPGIAGLMRGIGRFDQRGSISDALKQGFGTYVGGQGLRMLGGAGKVRTNRQRTNTPPVSTSSHTTASTYYAPNISFANLCPVVLSVRADPHTCICTPTCVPAYEFAHHIR